ncbi:hypothetical protein N431DRAFT_291494, partial [Stipitochalara longipes BDJ]
PTETVPIIVNNTKVRITISLHFALLRLQAEGVLHIWANALCINQGDGEEKTAQVGRMGAIYRKASEVAVWLGHEQDAMETAVQFCVDHEHIDEKNRLVILPTFKELLSNAYWNRIWVIQEIVVASSINVYCGYYKIGWGHFVDMIEFDVGTKKIFQEDEKISGFTTLLDIRKDTLARRPIGLLQALHRSRSSLSTDSRDKLYALLGLRYDGRHFIPEPKYMNSVAEVFTDFSIALIESGELLDLIYL